MRRAKVKQFQVIPESEEEYRQIYILDDLNILWKGYEKLNSETRKVEMIWERVSIPLAEK